MFNFKEPELPTAENALPGSSKPMQVNNYHFVNRHPIQGPFPEHLQQIVFGMGCFWGAEQLFWQQEGVYTTAVGYSAGLTPNPTYEEVCSGRTGHNEVMLLVFDPDIISLPQMLKIFWENHNPTEGMRQGNDRGTQYRSGIYTFSDTQFQIALKSKIIYQQAISAAQSVEISTEILPATDFYYAEDYHQQYLAKNPSGYCPNHTYNASGLSQFPLEQLMTEPHA
jgi:peptide-methionine (S)-S-oxide reductase